MWVQSRSVLLPDAEQEYKKIGGYRGNENALLDR